MKVARRRSQRRVPGRPHRSVFANSEHILLSRVARAQRVYFAQLQRAVHRGHYMFLEFLCASAINNSECLSNRSNQDEDLAEREPSLGRTYAQNALRSWDIATERRCASSTPDACYVLLISPFRCSSLCVSADFAVREFDLSTPAHAGMLLAYSGHIHTQHAFGLWLLCDTDAIHVHGVVHRVRATWTHSAPHSGCCCCSFGLLLL